MDGGSCYDLTAWEYGVTPWKVLYYYWDELE